MTRQLVNYSGTIHNLGTTLSSTLNWHDNTVKISKTVSRSLYQIRMSGDCFPLHVRKLLIESLIMPNFDYCCLVYNDLTGELGLRLERMLNACVRFIFGVPLDSHNTPFYNKLEWLKLPNRRKYFLCITIISVTQSGRPGYLYGGFTFMSSVCSRALRADDLDLQIPIHNILLL